MEATVALKWNTKDLEVKTQAVERTLHPLIVQVTTLTTLLSKPHTASRHKKGRSKRAQDLVEALQRATDVFIRCGQQIAEENPEIGPQMQAAVDQVRNAGETMSSISRDFTADSGCSSKRNAMVVAAKDLLSAVTRLLVLADMIDVHRLLRCLNLVQDDLERIRAVSSQQELEEAMRVYGTNGDHLMTMAGRRQQDLMDPSLRDELSAARAVLKTNWTLLMTASKAYLRHPELAAAKANRDFVLKQVCKAVDVISDAVRPDPTKSTREADYVERGGFSAALDDLDRRIIMDPMTFNEQRSRPSLEEQLESIISGAALMADSACTRDERRDRIVAECNAVRQALQDLLGEYITNAGRRDTSASLDAAVERMGVKTQRLRRQLRKAVADHVSDLFLEPDAALTLMMAAALDGDVDRVEEAAASFVELSGRIVEVAHLAVSVSSAQDQDGVKMVRHAAALLQQLSRPVVDAARILSLRPDSKPARHSADLFAQTWRNQVALLCECVDEIVDVDDLLAVSESHILEDINECLAALRRADCDAVLRTAHIATRRADRIGGVVVAEMGCYEKGVYTERVLQAVKMLREHALTNAGEKVRKAVADLKAAADVDENEFIDAWCLVYEGVRDIRRCVLMNRNYDQLDPDEVQIEDADVEAPDAAAVDGPTNASQEEREMMEQQMRSFETEKQNFDREVAKWDESGNDIVVMAKRMCLIMMDMADFGRGRGPLRTTMDVIGAAKKISECGSRLDRAARGIADHCAQSSTKDDLLAYLKQIDLYTHQLNITSRVKADVEQITEGDLTLGSLENATTLIQAAKNLMNVVVQTVKASYVASTKYLRRSEMNAPLLDVVWNMKPPEKKPLIRRQKEAAVGAVVRRGSQRRYDAPIRVLSQFHAKK